jgi:hypothetical protein
MSLRSWRNPRNVQPTRLGDVREPIFKQLVEKNHYHLALARKGFIAGLNRRMTRRTLDRHWGYCLGETREPIFRPGRVAREFCSIASE